MTPPNLAEAVAWCRDVASLLRAMQESERNGEKLTRKEKRQQREFTNMLREMTEIIRDQLLDADERRPN